MPTRSAPILGGSQEPEIRPAPRRCRPRPRGRPPSSRSGLRARRAVVGDRGQRPRRHDARAGRGATGSREGIPGSTCSRRRWRRRSASAGRARPCSPRWSSATTWRRASAARRRSGRRCTCTGSTEPWARRRRSRGCGSSTRMLAARALGVAAGLTLGTSWRTALGGATVRNAYAGVGGRQRMARRRPGGRRASRPLPDMLTETFGRISGTGLDAALALDGLGERFEVTRNYFKRYACCRFNHPAVEAIEEILAETPVPSDQIASIRVATSALGATMSRPGSRRRARREVLDSLCAGGAARPRRSGDCGVEPSGSPPCPTAGCGRSPGGWRSWRIPALTALTPARAARPRGGEPRRRARPRRGEWTSRAGSSIARTPRTALREKFVTLAAPEPRRPRPPRRAWDLCRHVGELKSARELTGGLRALARPRPRTDPEGAWTSA